jgi:hypothetical protein
MDTVGNMATDMVTDTKTKNKPYISRITTVSFKRIYHLQYHHLILFHLI